VLWVRHAGALRAGRVALSKMRYREAVSYAHQGS